jgi:hypothetical protein
MTVSGSETVGNDGFAIGIEVFTIGLTVSGSETIGNGRFAIGNDDSTIE